ncbi:MAG TPA: hypothetical protein VFC52_04660 [Solirubrobacterales bacterium]|nr:hypothetical protein [Solirubrobacterales bacterium]
MTHTRRFSVALAGLLSLTAFALWLSSGPAGHAATAEQTQGTNVQVQGKEISWASNGECTNSPQVSFSTADFGASPPGGGDLIWPPEPGTFQIACVLSNATWNIDAVATDLTALNEPNSAIPSTNLALTAGGLAFADSSPAPISQECDAVQQFYCDLTNSRSVVLGASPSPNASGFYFGYRLTVPPATAPETYTGSVTFTASN